MHVPAVRPELSARRMLTMEWIEGVKVTDAEGLSALGISAAAQVAPVLCRAFSSMIFESGFVHCDPHAGNLLVRRIGGPAAGAPPGGVASLGRVQLVILDHGMVRELTPTFRSEYCRLWRALLTRDKDEGRRVRARHCQRSGGDGPSRVRACSV